MTVTGVRSNPSLASARQQLRETIQEYPVMKPYVKNWETELLAHWQTGYIYDDVQADIDKPEKNPNIPQLTTPEKAEVHLSAMLYRLREKIGGHGDLTAFQLGQLILRPPSSVVVRLENLEGDEEEQEISIGGICCLTGLAIYSNKSTIRVFPRFIGRTFWQYVMREGAI